jgi:hypothetical protein
MLTFVKFEWREHRYILHSLKMLPVKHVKMEGKDSGVELELSQEDQEDQEVGPRELGGSDLRPEGLCWGSRSRKEEALWREQGGAGAGGVTGPGDKDRVGTCCRLA